MRKRDCRYAFRSDALKEPPLRVIAQVSFYIFTGFTRNPVVSIRYTGRVQISVELIISDDVCTAV